MTDQPVTTPVFRFAPSPNGALHLGHAFSVLLNARLARETGGRLLLRIEDIDLERCTPEREAAMLDDLEWLGVEFDKPYRRQSEHFSDYEAALESLKARNLVYPAFLTRGEVRFRVADAEAAASSAWPCDPDGAPLYPADDRLRAPQDRERRIAEGTPHAWRLDTARAIEAAGGPLHWREEGAGPAGETGLIEADPAAWGDVMIARKDVPTSYHLAVVVDDARQGVTHVVRGRDLFHATAVHRLLQTLLGLPAPVYRHHALVLGENGRKLSKSAGDTGLVNLRAAGIALDELRERIAQSLDEKPAGD